MSEKITFNDIVNSAKPELNIIDSKTLNDQLNFDEELVILDVNDKEDVANRGMIEGAINISLGTLYYKADSDVPDEMKDHRIQDRNKKVVVTCLSLIHI